MKNYNNREFQFELRSHNNQSTCNRVEIQLLKIDQVQLQVLQIHNILLDYIDLYTLETDINMVGQ